MSECATMRAALDEAALGGEIAEAQRSHLESCAQCAAQLEERRALAARIDAAIRAQVAAQPADALVDRVLARVRRPPRSRTRFGARSLWAALAAGFAAIALLFRLALPPAPSTAQITAWHSPTASLLEPVR